MQSSTPKEEVQDSTNFGELSDFVRQLEEDVFAVGRDVTVRLVDDQSAALLGGTPAAVRDSGSPVGLWCAPMQELD